MPVTICILDWMQMIREKKLERRRQRRKVAERQLQQQQEQEAEMMMTASPANHQHYLQEPETMSTSPPANVVDHVDAAARQHLAAPAEPERTRRRHRRRRPKPAGDDGGASNSWAAARSESEHLPARGPSTSVLVASSQSEPNASSLTPHPVLHNNDMSSPLANRDLTVRPAFLQKPISNDFDMEPRSYYSPHPSNVSLLYLIKS